MMLCIPIGIPRGVRCILIEVKISSSRMQIVFWMKGEVSTVLYDFWTVQSCKPNMQSGMVEGMYSSLRYGWMLMNVSSEIRDPSHVPHIK